METIRALLLGGVILFIMIVLVRRQLRKDAENAERERKIDELSVGGDAYNSYTEHVR